MTNLKELANGNTKVLREVAAGDTTVVYEFDVTTLAAPENVLVTDWRYTDEDELVILEWQVI